VCRLFRTVGRGLDSWEITVGYMYCACCVIMYICIFNAYMRVGVHRIELILKTNLTMFLVSGLVYYYTSFNNTQYNIK